MVSAFKAINMQERNTIWPKLQIFWTILVNSKTNLIDVSSNEYCCHIHQIEALVKTFLLHVVSHSRIFGSNLWL